MSLALSTGAFIAASAKNPATSSPHGSWIFTTLASTLHLAGYYQRHLHNALLPLFLQASLFASRLLHLGQTASVRTFQTTGRILYYSIQLSKQTAWKLWDSTQGRRFRKKIEFEFFTLILGGGGNNLCLVIFWPGWGILAVAGFVFSAWYAT
ncbi:hypothetical protein F4859DRAFT_341340 [Xylaria cf. heliscus]|nr:hypothetical protein F4859DRAFT_341340 [Xylaria cf. heliscus]